MDVIMDRTEPLVVVVEAITEEAEGESIDYNSIPLLLFISLLLLFMLSLF